MKTEAQILQRAQRAKIAAAIAIMALLGLIATSGHTDPGTPSTSTKFDPQTGAKIETKSDPTIADQNVAITQMRQRLVDELTIQAKTATLEELSRVETSNTELAMVVQNEMAVRINGSPTGKLYGIFKENDSPMLRLAIAKQITQHLDVTTEMALEMAGIVGDDPVYRDTAGVLASIVKQKAETLEPQVASALIMTQPQAVKQTLVNELLRRGQGVSTPILVNCFVNLGELAATHSDLFEAIMARTDRTIETTSLMLASLDLPRSQKAEKG